jgi:hypothetical protein
VVRICIRVQQYLQYVHKHYGTMCVIVFDGYCNGPSTKDHEHQKRAFKPCPDINIEEGKPVHRNQSAFLSNDYNKKGLVHLLPVHLSQAGYVVTEALNDADTLIVQTALKIAEHSQ